MVGWLASLLGARRAVAVGVMVVVGSGCAPAERDAPVVVRVAAPYGIERLARDPAPEGSAAAALDLVYAPLDDYASVVERGERHAVLERLSSSRLTTVELAGALRLGGIERATVVGVDRIRVEFRDEVARALFDWVSAVDDGRYRVEDHGPGWVRLARRRGAGAIDVIEIREVGSDEQWRRLYGRRLDVAPLVEERDRGELAGLDGVRVIEIDHPVYGAMLFDLSDPDVADVAVRRRLAAALDRDAIARVVCRSDRCRVPAPGAPGPDPGDAVALPSPFVVAVPDGDESAELAAEAIRHQLRAIGVETRVETLEPNRFRLREFSGAHAAVLPWGQRDYHYDRFRSVGVAGESLTGYANPAYDRAVAARDFAAARALLDRDVPVTPLYAIKLFAVVDRGLCGDVEPQATSWLWIAELRPCEPGEAP